MLDNRSERQRGTMNNEEYKVQFEDIKTVAAFKDGDKKPVYDESYDMFPEHIKRKLREIDANLVKMEYILNENKKLLAETKELLHMR